MREREIHVGLHWPTDRSSWQGAVLGSLLFIIKLCDSVQLQICHGFVGHLRIFSGKICIDLYRSKILHAKHARNTVLLFYYGYTKIKTNILNLLIDIVA